MCTLRRTIAAAVILVAALAGHRRAPISRRRTG